MTREIYIERDDFREDAPRKFFRLAPDREVRLRYGYVIHCDEVIKDASGEVVELRCSYLPETADGKPPEDGRKVKGIIHWVSASHSVTAEVRLYDHLFAEAMPGDFPEGGDFKDNLNPKSLETLRECRLETSLEQARPAESFQFERLGYFSVDPADSAPGALVFNRSVSLRDSWAKMEKKAPGGKQRTKGKS